MPELTVQSFKTLLSKQVGKNAQFFKPKEVQTLMDLQTTMRDEEIQEDINSLS